MLWFETEDDTPESVSGETGGPGDDCAVVLRGSSRVVEVHSSPGPTGYGRVRVARPPRGSVAPAAFPDLKLAVRSIFP